LSAADRCPEVSSEHRGDAAGSSAPVPEDAAWASVEIPLPPRPLFDFLSNAERLFRLNPHLEIGAWHHHTDQAPARNYRLDALNETNGCRSEVSIRVAPLSEYTGYILEYDAGLKRSTELRIAPVVGGSLLTITDHYRPVADEPDQRMKEVDRSLVPWLAAIRSHLTGLARFGGVPGYRWWTERIMLGMVPRQRRIVRMIVWVSVLEFVVFLFVALIFWLESRPS
jgi:hypothetical protein